MKMTDELERLARLRASGALTEAEFVAAKRRLLFESGAGAQMLRCVRRQSATTLLGLPLWAVAFGPDLERGEFRGHAKGVFAFGDMATGWFAFGGLARAFVAFGGLAIGAISFGGASIGALLAVGGGALGGVALGGGAVGGVAIGGGAVGYYAQGGGAAGTYVMSARRQDPEAREFFTTYFPWTTAMRPRHR
jgi:hypothetical protein